MVLAFSLLLVGVVGCASMQREDYFARGAVAADHHAASEAGARILRQGGNAVDAAVATSFALSVVRPYSCGIGGGGFMVIHLAGGRTVVLDYRETAPGAVQADFYEGLSAEASTTGGTAVATPGTVAGLLLALERYGTLPRQQVLAPAIELAETGFIVDQHYVDSVRPLIRRFRDDPSLQHRFAFVWDRFLRQGEVGVGDRIVLPEQAAALRLIAEQGASAFYEGPIARAIVSAVQGDGGVLTLDDLGTYQLQLRAALEFQFAGRRFLTMPPPSSGGVAMAQALGIFELIEDPSVGVVGVTECRATHALVEAFKHAFADRAEWLADPDFVALPLEQLLSPVYLHARAALFDPAGTLAPSAYGTREDQHTGRTLPDDSGTSHLSVVDRWGNAVACTETINLTFGSLVAVEEYGFILNNEMDDFTTRRGQANAFGLRQSERNLPAAGKRPLSSMTPTIVLDGRGRVEVVAGGAGGPRIITATMQAILHALDGMDAPAALAAPRLHHQWAPDILHLEPELARDAQLRACLAALGHEVQETRALANVQLIVRAGRGWSAASDPRKGGRPAGH
jgi:gamma-glutamyltranspeptidase / glutathione hydrolase